MPDWLAPIRNLLDNAASPIAVFFRDDDAGWDNGRLCSLLDVFAKAGIPIDLAVIPGALEKELSSELLSRWQQNKHLLGLHQHGYCHANHEREGRKCEFGSSRPKGQQYEDIAAGKQNLADHLGNALDPFFTPPWNRCTQATLDCLEELNFQLLSRDVTAAGLESSSIKQIPVHIDWSKIIKTSAQALAELGEVIANNTKHNKLTGIMLHHADMDRAQLQPLAELLAVFSGHNKLRGLLLRDLIGRG
jgi:peptidoglycan/xylan/chitin deacetylase (PgdA/CDA1 family)